VPASNSSLLGSIVATRSGTLTLTAGSLTVVADSRLNRLIAHGTARDVELIDGYLAIIDKDRSITSIETYGSSRVIELKHTPAAEVAAAIRDAYAGRIASAGSNSRSNQRGGGERQGEGSRERRTSEREEEADSPDDGDRREQSSEPSRRTRSNPDNQTPRDLEPKMTIAVHEPSNSLIVTAPDQLFEEVERLAKLIDQRNEKVIEFIAPANRTVVDAIFQVLSPGSQPPGRAPASSTRSSETAAGSSRPSPVGRANSAPGSGPTNRLQQQE
jgi:type II secretory pathway component GspD/PulD (secretin)